MQLAWVLCQLESFHSRGKLSQGAELGYENTFQASNISDTRMSTPLKIKRSGSAPSGIFFFSAYFPVDFLPPYFFSFWWVYFFSLLPVSPLTSSLCSFACFGYWATLLFWPLIPSSGSRGSPPVFAYNSAMSRLSIAKLYAYFAISINQYMLTLHMITQVHPTINFRSWCRPSLRAGLTIILLPTWHRSEDGGPSLFCWKMQCSCLLFQVASDIFRIDLEQRGRLFCQILQDGCLESESKVRDQIIIQELSLVHDFPDCTTPSHHHNWCTVLWIQVAFIVFLFVRSTHSAVFINFRTVILSWVLILFWLPQFWDFS